MLTKIKNSEEIDNIITEYVYVIKKNNHFIGVNEEDFKKNKSLEISPKDILKTIKKRKRRRKRRRKKQKNKF